MQQSPPPFAAAEYREPGTRPSPWEEESPPPTEVEVEPEAADTASMRGSGVPRARTFPRALSGSFSAPTSPMARPLRNPSVDWATPRTAIADAVRARINMPGRAMSEAGSIVAEGMDAAATAAAELIKVPLAVAGIGVACV